MGVYTYALASGCTRHNESESPRAREREMIVAKKDYVSLNDVKSDEKW